jgi:hydroxymethylpyrimidine kinase/phosphomethylpyrimidine kinase
MWSCAFLAFMSLAVVLSIAGSDSGGGAGIQADLKTFQALGCFGTTAITAITCQNTTGVRGVQAMTPEIVRNQILAVTEDFPVRAAKTGMLFSTEIIDAVSKALDDTSYKFPIVVDPVMVASTGARLLREDAEKALASFLVRAAVITPNVPESEVLLGRKIVTLDDMEKAALDLHEMTGSAVLVKGGHRAEHGNVVFDVLYDGAHFEILEAMFQSPRNTHGTGCTLSAGIAAGLARGLSIVESVREAKKFLVGALAGAPGLGHGTGPLNHLWMSGLTQN